MPSFPAPQLAASEFSLTNKTFNRFRRPFLNHAFVVLALGAGATEKITQPSEIFGPRTAFSELKLTPFLPFLFAAPARLQPSDAAAARAPGRPVVGGVHDGGGREPLWLRVEDRPPRPPALAPTARAAARSLAAAAGRCAAVRMLTRCSFHRPDHEEHPDPAQRLRHLRPEVPDRLRQVEVRRADLPAERQCQPGLPQGAQGDAGEFKLNIKATEAKRKKLVANKQFELADYIKKAIGRSARARSTTSRQVNYCPRLLAASCSFSVGVTSVRLQGCHLSNGGALSIEFFLQPWGEVLSVGPGTVQPSLRVGRAVYSDVARRATQRRSC